MMKVQSQPPAVQSAAASKTSAPAATTAAAKPAAAEGAAPANAGQLTDRFKDGFESKKMEPGKGIIDCFPNWPPVKKDTMSLGDHINASQLPEALNNPLNKPLLEEGNKDTHLSRDDQGVMRGPDNQPLAQVALEDGTTAYVDPNTNQYYLTDEKDWFGQGVDAVGPLPLPPEAQFSNSYFSDADVQSIQRDAQGGFWPPHKLPIDPLPLPKFPKDPWGPIMPANPRVLLGADGVKG